MWYSMESKTRSYAFPLALGAAICAHVALVLPYLTDSQPTRNVALPSLSVTIAAPSDDQRPEQAGFQSIANQQGAGSSEQLRRLKFHESGDANNAPNQDQNTRGQQADQDLQSSAGVISVAGNQNRLLGPGEIQLAQSSNDKIRSEDSDNIAAELDLSAQQLLGLGEDKGQAVATVENARAGYLYRWRQRIQATGLGQVGSTDLTGSLTLTATIDFKGRLLGYQIAQSSGLAQLDATAVNILQAATPFEPFPNAMMAFDDRISITRIWQFNAGAPTLR